LLNKKKQKTLFIIMLAGYFANRILAPTSIVTSEIYEYLEKQTFF
jgi:hypothetical protein